MNIKSIQDYYEERFAHCYGCGRLNKDGHQFKTFWEGDETITKFTPGPDLKSLPGFIYGGLIASMIDCHGTGSAALAYAKENNIELEEFNAPRFVTGSLCVSYKKPTPMGPELVVKGKIKEVKGRKVVIDATLIVEGEICATGEVISLLVPEDFGQK
ncbi:MAG: PaaI family thioesterase [Candidatus Aminicenantes bacterium]|nr:PaaI family thioesterase [Candidatus Aminicenantes bacterium]